MSCLHGGSGNDWPPFRLQEGAINMVLYLPIAVNILTYFGYESDTLYTIKYNIYIYLYNKYT